jgi:hypothetical protein
MKNEIILYKTGELAEHIEVRLDDNTVWLTQLQMATLFGQTKQNVSLHINNCFKEGELEKSTTVKESLTVQIEGSRSVNRKIEYYNLDVIISVGYRVKSKQGTQFRIWATNVLIDYLLKGYALNQRIDRIESNFENLNKEVKQISLQLQLDLDKHKSQYPPITLKTYANSHDRFLIMDQKELYHLGASLKDLGKKWFAFSKMDSLSADVLAKLKLVV